jgi:hypothetical protein
VGRGETPAARAGGVAFQNFKREHTFSVSRENPRHRCEEEHDSN